MNRTQEKDSGETEDVVNDVRLVGRLTGEPALVELPSGDALVTFRISVPRPSPSVNPSGSGAGQTGGLRAVHGMEPAAEAQHRDVAGG